MLESPAGCVAPFVRRTRPLGFVLATMPALARPLSRVRTAVLALAGPVSLVRPVPALARPVALVPTAVSALARTALARTALLARRPVTRLLVPFLTSPTNVKHFHFAMIAGRFAQLSAKLAIPVAASQPHVANRL